MFPLSGPANGRLVRFGLDEENHRFHGLLTPNCFSTGDITAIVGYWTSRARRSSRSCAPGTACPIEIFCDPDPGQVALLEINPRHSQPHAEPFEFDAG